MPAINQIRAVNEVAPYIDPSQSITPGAEYCLVEDRFPILYRLWRKEYRAICRAKLTAPYLGWDGQNEQEGSGEYWHLDENGQIDEVYRPITDEEAGTIIRGLSENNYRVVIKSTLSDSLFRYYQSLGIVDIPNPSDW